MLQVTEKKFGIKFVALKICETGSVITSASDGNSALGLVSDSLISLWPDDGHKKFSQDVV